MQIEVQNNALSVRLIIQDSVPVPCQGLSLPILAYATNLDYASLKYGRSLHKMLSHLQTTGSSHANISTPLKCTVTVSHTDCICMDHHNIMHSLRLAPNNVYIRLVLITYMYGVHVILLSTACTCTCKLYTCICTHVHVLVILYAINHSTDLCLQI